MNFCRGMFRCLAAIAFATLLALPEQAWADSCPATPNLPSADGSQKIRQFQL